MTPKWEIVPEQTTEHWLEIKAPDNSWHGFAKWDGCVQIYERDSTPEMLSEHDCQANCEHYHLDELDDFLERLTELREKIRAHFGEGWE